MEQFEVGDVVMLKSGGPLMTVDYISQEPGISGISCKWFIGNDLRSDTFNAGALTKTVPGQSDFVAGGSRPSGPPVW